MNSYSKRFATAMLLSWYPLFCNAQNITIQDTDRLPATISVNKGKVGFVWIAADPNLPLVKYLQGVVRSEMGELSAPPGATLSDGQRVKAYQAQAIAAATYIARRNPNKLAAMTVDNSERFQTYLPPTADSAGYDVLIAEAITEATKSLAVFYRGSPAETLYFSGTLSGFTNNSYECSMNGRYYNPEMSRQVTPEKLNQEKGRSGCGMSQVGAKHLASSLYNRDAAGILAYYYGSMPPYVKSLSIDQDGTEIYQVDLKDNVHDETPNTNSTIRQWEVPKGAILGAAKCPVQFNLKHFFA